MTHGTTWGSSYKDADKHHKGLNYGGQRLGVGGEEVKAITLDSLNLTGVSLIKVRSQGELNCEFKRAPEQGLVQR